MKVIVLCLILTVAYAEIGGRGQQGQAGTYHQAGHANNPTRGQTIGGYPGTHHTGQVRPGTYHEAGHANNPTRGQIIGGYPGTHHTGQVRPGTYHEAGHANNPTRGQTIGGSQGGIGATHQGGYKQHGY